MYNNKMAEMEENEIIERILAGERELYALLIDRYKVPVFNLAFRMTGSLEDADDLAQETFARAFTRLCLFNRALSFFTWLYTIGINVIRNHLGKKERDCLARSGSVNDDEYLLTLIDSGDNPELIIVHNQLRKLLESCLLMLPVDLREALVLRYYQELSFEDMAKISGHSVGAMKMRVYRGIEELEQMMKEEFL
jgi:RNA polymerase sigma-70 factor, ECF subfamily